MIKAFLAIGDLLTGARARKAAEAEEFLAFFRGLVESVPSDVARAFGNMSNIGLINRDGTEMSAGIELNATDYMWWRRALEQDGKTFKFSVRRLKMRMLEVIAKKTEAAGLTAEERAKLLGILDEAMSEGE